MITNELIENNQLFPWLLIGGAVVDFKKKFNGRIEHIENLEQLRDLVSFYNGVKNLPRLIVIDDISVIGKDSEQVILKFTEETKLKVVILSYFDVVSSVFLSRMKRVDKYSVGKVESNFRPVSKGYREYCDGVESNTLYYDKVLRMSKISPKLWYLEKEINSKKLLEKIVSIL